MDSAAKIRTFIVEKLDFNGLPQELTDDYPLLDGEAVDSMGIFQLVGYLEDEFYIEVEDEEIVPDNFNTVAAIVAFVDRKQA